MGGQDTLQDMVRYHDQDSGDGHSRGCLPSPLLFESDAERLINVPRTISRFLPQLHRKIAVNKIHEEKQEERTRPSQPKQGINEKSRGKRETCKSQIAFFFFWIKRDNRPFQGNVFKNL